jgi:endonuclease/exonuclease/phosphatase family metal-dependent hydrolase
VKPRSGSLITLCTFNVQRGRRPDGAIDNALLAATCAAIDVDVLALQEVTDDQPPLIADACGMVHVFGPAIPGYGNALLSRTPIEQVEIVALDPSDGREPRAAIVARTAGVTVAATHLGLRGDAEHQLPRLLGALAGRPGPHVLLGDLNDEHPVVAPFELAPPQRTFPAHAPRRRIDHVAVAGLEIVSVDVLEEQAVGDHRPVVVALEHREG